MPTPPSEFLITWHEEANGYEVAKQDVYGRWYHTIVPSLPKAGSSLSDAWIAREIELLRRKVLGVPKPLNTSFSRYPAPGRYESR